MKEENECGGSCSSCAGCSHDEHTEFDSILTLVDENGKDVQFVIEDVIVLEDEKEYLVVVEAGVEEPEALILEVKEEDGEEVYDTVTDEEVAKKVYDKYISGFETEEEVEEETSEEK